MSSNSIRDRIIRLANKVAADDPVIIYYADGTHANGKLVDIISQLRTVGDKAIVDFRLTQRSIRPGNGLLPELLNGLLKQEDANGE